MARDVFRPLEIDMKAQFALKTLGLVAVTTLTLGASLAQADNAYGQPCLGAGNPYLTASYGWPGHHDPQFRNGYGPFRGDITRQVERRQAHQKDRIDLGVARGNITRREAAKLYREQDEIDQMQRYFLADGHLSRGEYLALDEALDRAGRNIRHQAHDNEWRW